MRVDRDDLMSSDDFILGQVSDMLEELGQLALSKMPSWQDLDDLLDANLLNASDSRTKYRRLAP